MNPNAFPIPGLQSDSDFNGLSMRDYFAAHAPITVQDAMVAWGYDATSVGCLPRADRITVMAGLAQMRSDYADAMLAERAK